ncbi:FAD-dependent oxidoreductase [Zhihengliuella halotolerans]|uniref:FAD-dependent oxidoreductase n=1 Tax=Zhihengliuella halotolerans TaxID=370736 RepID=UPI000C7FB1CD|nr:FAD-dependent oxidoreductase [Zhihengliuella halotolerans]
MNTTSQTGRRIVVVGGVAGGMSFAARARRLDESAVITVLDRGRHVSFANCGLPYHLDGEIAEGSALTLRTPESFRPSGIDVRTGHDVVALDPHARTVTVEISGDGGPRTETIAYDELLLSPGGRTIVPDVEGLAAGFASGRVRTLRTVDDATGLRADILAARASTAVVVGAGFIGLETAEALAAAGLEVALIQRSEQILSPLERELAHLVAEEAARLGIRVLTGRQLRAYRPGTGEGDVVVLDDGTELAADATVIATGITPDTDVFAAAGIECDAGAILTDEHGRTSMEHVWAVGDATARPTAVTGVTRATALAGPANRAGRLVADAMLGANARPLPPAQGTAVVRVGALTAAMTGANRAELDAAGTEYETLHLHPLQHAGYFPGAEQIHLVVHIGPDGRLLGAQAVGRDGVDKRIDVIATAMRGGLGVADLIDLDLAYAPPYGSAKDPVNFAGMLGENVTSGLVRLWHAAEAADLDGAVVLDVRNPDEVATGTLPGALLIPVNELRGRLGEVFAAAGNDGARPVRILCASGVRSAAAYRIIDQAAAAEGLQLDVATLSGGMLTLRAWYGDDVRNLLAVPEGAAA